MNIERVLWIAGVLISTMTTYYFYHISIQRREPTAIISSERTTIVNSNAPELSDLTVLFKGNEINGKNVAAMRIYFWNAGSLAIHKADILENDHVIRLSFPENVQVLKPLLLRASRTIINMKVLFCTDNKRDICINFDLLEHNDGAAIQIIYAGPSNVEPIMSGTIEGAGTIKMLKIYKNLEEVPFFETLTYFPLWYVLIVTISSLSSIAFAVFLIYLIIFRKGKVSLIVRSRKMLIIIFAVSLLNVLGTLAGLIGKKYVGPYVPEEINVAN